MEASIREAEALAHPDHRDGVADVAGGVPLPLAGLRVALVHDWLTGMRGGEKCLEVLCRIFPEATLYTLIHRRGSLSPTIEAMAIRTSPLQKIPGVFGYYRHLLPVMPLATRSWRLKNVDLVISMSHCVAKAVVPPPGVPHVCYCFTPMRYAWQGRETYLESWSDRPVAGCWRDPCSPGFDAGIERRPAGSTISLRSRRRSVKGSGSVIARQPGDPASGGRRVLYARSDHSSRRPLPRRLGAGSLQTDRPGVTACTQSRRRLTIIGEGPERARLQALAGPSVRFMGWQSDEVIRDQFRHCRALLFPGEEDFGFVPIEASPAAPGHRPGSRRRSRDCRQFRWPNL